MADDRTSAPPARARSLADLATRMAGAPLDLAKAAAAGFMLLDHVNTALLNGTVPLLWRCGRIAYPLFAFVLACHLARGADPARYARTLLVAAIVTQPFFAAAFRGDLGNVLFTLAAGAALAATLLKADARWAHLAFAAGAAAIFLWPVRARTGVDFGLAGILFPAALTLALRGAHLHVAWALVLLVGLNAGGVKPDGETLLQGVTLDALFAGLGSLLVLALCGQADGRGRFLPRYALYLFYPAHLAALALLRAAGFAIA